jgi:hypothetical protein
MGEQQRKLVAASRMVKFDLASPRYLIVKEDITNLTKTNSDPFVGASKLLINNIIRTKFPQGGPRADRKIFAAWLEILEGTAGSVLEMPQMQLDWLYQIAKDETLPLDMSMAQWCEALIDSIEEALSGVTQEIG